MKRALSLLAMVSVMSSVSWAQAPQRGAGGAPGGARGPAGAPGGAATTPPPPARGAAGGGGGRGALTPIVQVFEATPASIKAGEGTILSWTTESGSTSINNGIGNVANKGAIRVTPATTTTYVLTIGAVTKSVTVTVTGAAAGAATNANANVAKTVNGKPDFTGVYGGWNTNGPGGSRGLGAPRGAATPPGVETPYGSLPTTPTIKTGVSNRGSAANPAGGTADCLPLPADTAFGVPYPFQIIQSKDFFVFFFEYPGTFRIVPLDGSPHPPDPDPSWMGDSVGHWEGQTLVIDTIGYNGRHSISGIQQPSENFHTIERLSRTGTTGLFYEIIYEDPDFATGQWRSTYSFQVDTRPGVNRVYEFICENNRDYTPLFGAGGPPAAGGGGARGGGPPAAGGGVPGGGGAPRGGGAPGGGPRGGGAGAPRGGN